MITDAAEWNSSLARSAGVMPKARRWDTRTKLSPARISGTVGHRSCAGSSRGCAAAELRRTARNAWSSRRASVAMGPGGPRGNAHGSPVEAAWPSSKAERAERGRRRGVGDRVVEVANVLSAARRASRGGRRARAPQAPWRRGGRSAPCPASTASITIRAGEAAAEQRQLEGPEITTGSIQSATPTAASATVTAPSAQRTHEGAGRPPSSGRRPAARERTRRREAANSATHAHAWSRPKSKISRCASVIVSTETESTTAAARGSRSPPPAARADRVQHGRADAEPHRRRPPAASARGSGEEGAGRLRHRQQRDPPLRRPRRAAGTRAADERQARPPSPPATTRAPPRRSRA